MTLQQLCEATVLTCPQETIENGTRNTAGTYVDTTLLDYQLIQLTHKYSSQKYVLNIQSLIDIIPKTLRSRNNNWELTFIYEIMYCITLGLTIIHMNVVYPRTAPFFRKNYFPKKKNGHFTLKSFLGMPKKTVFAVFAILQKLRIYKI